MEVPVIGNIPTQLPAFQAHRQLFDSFEDCVEQLPQLLIEQKEEVKSE